MDSAKTMSATIRESLRRMPVLWRFIAPPKIHFDTSSQYWEERYARGGTSGAGSYGRLAQFKADVINGHVRAHNVARVVELGCGDGNQLSLAQYPSYLGLDVSSTAVQACKAK